MDENICKEIDESVQSQFLEGQQRKARIANHTTSAANYFSSNGQLSFVLGAIVFGVLQFGVFAAVRRLYPKALETVERQFGKMRLGQPSPRCDLFSTPRFRLSLISQ